LFRNLRINIFIFYLLTTSVFLLLLYYAVTFLHIQNIFLLGIILFFLVILSAVFISKLAVDPLMLYVRNLQNLSKETLHELNLPISTIETNIQLLKKNLSEDKEKKRLERIESASLMLKQRYSELDYLIKMQTKQEIKEQVRVDVLVQQRVDFLEKIYPNMKFRLQLTQYELFVDKIGLTKVIDNLIDNGVKYSADSKVIEIELKNSILCIRDYGIGMDKVELLAIFDRYYQVNSDMPGFGIGLNMVKRFCDENDIELIFNSNINQGTTVKLKFKEKQER